MPKQSVGHPLRLQAVMRDTVYWKAQWWTSDNEGLGTSGWPGGNNGGRPLGHQLALSLQGQRLVRQLGSRHQPDDGQRVHLRYEARLRRLHPRRRRDRKLAAVQGCATRRPQLFPDNNSLGLIPGSRAGAAYAGGPPTSIGSTAGARSATTMSSPASPTTSLWNRGRSQPEIRRLLRTADEW